MMNREFRFITRGKIIQELFDEGLTNFSFSQLHRMEKRGFVPPARKGGGGWRIYSRQEADKVKKIVWEYYGGEKTYKGIPDKIGPAKVEKFKKQQKEKEFMPIIL